MVWRALDDGFGIMIGGDINIWELDGCENETGRRMKENMNEIGLQILNCVWDGLNEATCWLQTTQPTSGGAVTADKNCCANCVEPSRPQQWGPDLPFFGHAGHADPLDGWRCCSQKRVMSRPIQVRQH